MTLGGLDAGQGLLLTLLAGAVGRVVYELLILQGNIEFPHKLTDSEISDSFQGSHAIATYMYDLGLIARILIGAVAAIAALTITIPENLFKLLTAAVVAGSAGTSIFRSFQDRLQATIAQKETVEVKANNVALQGKVEEVGQAFSRLKTALVTASTSPRNSNELVFEEFQTANQVQPTVAIEAQLIETVERLINEARGLRAVSNL